ncbi:MAG: TonB-dependent receptor, partial [Chitinophagaceae bacterium]
MRQPEGTKNQKNFARRYTKPKDLDEVVVTGQYKPQSAKNSVYQVRVINSERIQKQGAAQLQDVLKNELNIRFSQDVATGGGGITMLGLAGQNVKILIDGLPMVGRQGATNEININQVDINSIERIEIVEGPMSVVYGADALAGVINIITKRAALSKFSIQARLHEESVGNEYGNSQGIHNQYAAFTTRRNKWEAGASFGHNYFGGWKDTATGRELIWHKKDQLIANGFLGYTNGKLSVRYRLDGLDEVITNPGNYLDFTDPFSGENLAFDQEFLTRRLMQQLQASYFANSKLNFQAQAAYTNYRRQVFSTTLSKQTGDVRLNISEGAQSIVYSNGFTFRGTSSYKLSEKVSLQSGVDINMESGEGERLANGKNVVNDYALFITTEISPSEKIKIRPGLRFIKNSVYDAPPVIPSINTKIILGKNLDLRLSYANGFRSPSLRELYFSFFDVNHQIIGNPNLKAETSNSFTGSVNWRKTSPQQIVFTANSGGFYNSIKNLIDYVYTPGSDTAIVSNFSGSKTAGVNIGASARNKNWAVTIGGSYTGFYNSYA